MRARRIVGAVRATSSGRQRAKSWPKPSTRLSSCGDIIIFHNYQAARRCERPRAESDTCAVCLDYVAASAKRSSILHHRIAKVEKYRALPLHALLEKLF